MLFDKIPIYSYYCMKCLEENLVSWLFLYSHNFHVNYHHNAMWVIFLSKSTITLLFRHLDFVISLCFNYCLTLLSYCTTFMTSYHLSVSNSWQYWSWRAYGYFRDSYGNYQRFSLTDIND